MTTVTLDFTDSAKNRLRNAVNVLTEEEAREVLALVSSYAHEKDIPLTLRSLANDPSIRLPRADFKGFKDVKPARVEGPPASELLDEDRR